MYNRVQDINIMDDKDTNLDDREAERFVYPKVSIVGALMSSVVLGGLLLLTRPEDGPVTIIMALIGLFIFVLSVINILLERVTWFITGKRMRQIRSFYMSLLMATGIVFLAGLQTLGQLEISDVILTSIFILILGFYILRRL